MIIAIDAGHGHKRNMPTGARAGKLVEDDIALTIAHKVRWYLLDRGHHVIMTRPGKQFVELKERPKIAKQGKADLFLSIHCNAAANPVARGAEAFVVERDMRSCAVAQKLVNAVVAEGMGYRGVRWDSQSQHKSLYVLRNTYARMPAVLLEVGFLTSPVDAAMLADGSWIERVSLRLAEAVNKLDL